TRNVLASNPTNLFWTSLQRFPEYVQAGLVSPSAHYRVLVMNNQEDGMTQLIQAGAHLTQDYFDESIDRWSFGNLDDYRCFLVRRGADRVLVQDWWVRRGTSNELAMLEQLVARGDARVTFRSPSGAVEYSLAPALACAAGGAS